MAKLVDAPDLGSGNSGCVGSSPIRRTDMKLHRADFSPMQFIQTPTHELLISVEHNDILR